MTKKRFLVEPCPNKIITKLDELPEVQSQGAFEENSIIRIIR